MREVMFVVGDDDLRELRGRVAGAYRLLEMREMNVSIERVLGPPPGRGAIVERAAELPEREFGACRLGVCEDCPGLAGWLVCSCACHGRRREG